MTEKPQRLSNVVRDLVPEETDTRRWSRAEHYLEHAHYCLLEILLTLSKLANWSEDEKSQRTAVTCYTLVKDMLLAAQHPYHKTLDYIQTMRELENARE